jgi:hypothetical protein
MIECVLYSGISNSGAVLCLNGENVKEGTMVPLLVVNA